MRKGRNGQDIKPALNVISAAAGKTLRVYSCFRSQARQNEILKRRGCKPFGRKNCSQSVARVSQHTKTIAADIRSFISNKRKQCLVLAKGRSVTGGRGGVGTYSGGDGHFDLGSARAWNRCAGVVGGNTGYRSNDVARYNQRSPANQGGRRKCYRTKRYPSCCGPVRVRRGLCSM